MLKALFALITVGCQLLVPLVEVGVNVWNVASINQMILDPDSGYGKESFFDSFFAELVPSLTSKSNK